MVFAIPAMSKSVAHGPHAAQSSVEGFVRPSWKFGCCLYTIVPCIDNPKFDISGAVFLTATLPRLNCVVYMLNSMCPWKCKTHF